MMSLIVARHIAKLLARFRQILELFFERIHTEDSLPQKIVITKLFMFLFYGDRFATDIVKEPPKNNFLHYISFTPVKCALNPEVQ